MAELSPYDRMIKSLQWTLIPIPYAATNDCCVVCEATLPFGWPSKEGHLARALCSQECADKRKRTHCKHIWCKSELDPLKSRYPFCDEICEEEDYQERLDAFRDDAREWMATRQYRKRKL